MRKELISNASKINITDILSQIISDIVSETMLFAHIDMERVLVCLSSNRKDGRGGTYAKLVPLRFKNGSQVLRHRGRFYSLPEITKDGNSCLYIVYFYMPRFFDLTCHEKLRVIFHELYHISPEFNGDIRRMGKRKAAHGHSKDRFNSLFTEELESFMAGSQKRPWMNFLQMDARALFRNYAAVLGRRMKNPKPAIVD